MRRKVPLFTILFLIAGILAADTSLENGSLAADSNPESKSLAEDSNPESKSLAEDSNSENESLAEDSNPESKSLAEDSNPENKSLAEDSNSENESLAEDSDSENESLAEDRNSESESLAEDSNSENEHSSEETLHSIESEEEEGVTWIHDYERNTHTNAIIDFNLYQIGENEECHLERNNDIFTFDQLLENTVEGVKPHNSNDFVSCRVTIGPMTDELLGKWILVGSHVKDGITYKRKQAVTLKWRSHQRLWDINENRVNHVVNFGAIITPFINRYNDVQDCHLVTPDGVDLHLLTEFKYPNITRLMNSRSCAAEMGPMYPGMLGDWVIYGIFGTSLPDIVTRPLHIFLYDEENPYEQAYNRTIYEPIDHVINLGTTIRKKLTERGTVDECNIIMPDGELYTLQPGFKFAGVTVEESTSSFECSIAVGPVDKEMLGEYKLVAKFSNEGIFTELQEEFKIIQEDPANPIEDSSRKVEYLNHQFIDTDMGEQLRITITLYMFQETDSCHIQTPDGLQYTIMEGFNIPGVEVIESDTLSCGVLINVVSEDLIGNWTLISRKTQYISDYLEQRLPITIYVEEIVNASPTEEVVVAEGNDFYIRLEKATTQYDTCMLHDPHGDPAITYELDDRFTDRCGFIVRKVTPTDNGKWEIIYGSKIVYKAEVRLNVQAAPMPIQDTMQFRIGRPVDLRLGDPNSIFCRVEDPSGSMVFHGFGVCRIQLDKVTHAHQGFWKLYVGAPGHILTHQYFIDVTLIEPESPIEVDTSVVMSSHASVLVSCGVTTPHQVLACKFRDPWGRVLLASHGLGEDRYTFHGDGISFNSGMYHVDCGLKIDQPEVSDLGLWRCVIETEKENYYGFLSVLCPWSMAVPEIAAQVRSEPVLTASKNNIEVLTGDRAKLLCKVSSAIRYCYFVSNNGTVINLSPNNDENDMYSYIGEGFQAGECGLQMRTTKTVDDGLWTCKVGLTNTTEQEQSAVIRLKVDEYFIHNRFYLQDYSEVIQGHSHKYMPIEYCRFVRSDGFAFNTENVPTGYDGSRYNLDQGDCGIQIYSPTVLDNGRWTVVIKIKNELDEIVVISEPIPTIIVKGTLYSSFTIFYITTIILLIATVLLAVSIKRSRRRIVSGAIVVRDTIRNSIRKKPLNNDPNVRNNDVAYAI